MGAMLTGPFQAGVLKDLALLLPCDHHWAPLISLLSFGSKPWTASNLLLFSSGSPSAGSPCVQPSSSRDILLL